MNCLKKLQNFEKIVQASGKKFGDFENVLREKTDF